MSKHPETYYTEWARLWKAEKAAFARYRRAKPEEREAANGAIERAMKRLRDHENKF